MKKQKKKNIKCFSTTVQIFSKAAQAQLRERAYDYKVVRWDNYHKVVSALVVRCGTWGGKVTASRVRPSPAARYIFCYSGLISGWMVGPSSQLCRTCLPGRWWDPPVRSARGTGLSGPWDMMKDLSRKKSHLYH
jgi:hypothetical protein